MQKKMYEVSVTTNYKNCCILNGEEDVSEERKKQY